MSDQIIIRPIEGDQIIIRPIEGDQIIINPRSAQGVQGIQGPVGANGDVVGPETSVDGNFASWDGTGGNTLKDSGSKASDFAAKAILTTKGDLYVRDATGVTRLPAGDDGDILMVDSSQAKGVAWSPPVDFATTSEVTGVHTTGSITADNDEMTVASATGIVAGMYVVGEGIAPGTTVATVVDTTVTLSANAGVTLSSDPVGFYVADKVLSPGLTAGMLCRAWVNFNGTETVAIRAAMNVSSITDEGTGKYTVNFTTAMPDANYSVAIAGRKFDDIDDGNFTCTYGNTVRLPTTTSVPITTGKKELNQMADYPSVSVLIFR